MTTANKIILTILIASIMTFAVSSIANAEPFEVEVPFDYEKSGCTYTLNVTERYDCYMESTEPFTNPNHLSTSTDDGCEEGYDRDLDTHECKLDAVIEEEAWQACYDDPTCPVGIWNDPVTKKIVNNEDIITADEMTASEKVTKDYTNALKDLCAYDIALYQDGTEFEVAFDEYLDHETGELRTKFKKFFDMKSIDLGTLDPDTRRLMLAVEACIGESELKVREKIAWLTTDTEDKQVNHADVAFGIPPIGQSRLNEIENAKVEQQGFSIVNDICNGYYTNSWKLTFKECQVDYSVGNGTAPVMKDTISGEIKEQLEQYVEDDGDQMAKDLTKKHIEEKIASLRKQMMANE